MDTLQRHNLPRFVPLLEAFQSGNLVAWRRALAKDVEWLRANGIWLVLFERGETLVWRNLFRSAWSQYIHCRPIAATKTHCPTWVLMEAMEVCFRGSGEIEDGTLRMEDVIDVLSTLIEHVSQSSRSSVGR
jgi:hypothetical protein